MAYDCYVGNKLTKDIQFCAGKTNCLTHIPNDINLELDPLNVTIVGSPTITNGIVSGFSTNNYLTLPNSTPATMTNLDANFRFKLNISSGDYPILWSVAGNDDIFVETSSKKVCNWNGSSKTSGVTILSSNVYYNLRIISSDGVNFSYYLKEGDYIENINEYVLQFTITNSNFQILSSEIKIGVYGNQSFSTGSIDLSQSYIKINGSIWWKGGTGKLTLKAGSKVYVPNGFESDSVTPKFDEVVIENDETLIGSWGTNGSTLIYLNSDKHLYQIGLITDRVSSGSTAPTATNAQLWYDTTNNIIKKYSGGSLAQTGCSLPIALCNKTDGTESTIINSIDQVFNYVGYIGSHVFRLPVNKGLIANGFNDNGTYSNIEFISNNVDVRYGGYGGTLTLWSDFNIFGNWEYVQQEIEPSVTTRVQWYQPSTNKVYFHDANETNWIQLKAFPIAEIVSSSDNKITSLTPRVVQTNNSTIQVKRIHKGADLIWIKDKFIMEQRNTGTYTLNIEFDGNYRLLFVGNGAGGGSGQRDSKWFQSSGGSGACFEGIVKLTKGTYTVTLGTLGYGYNKSNSADLTGGVNSTASYLTDSNGNELIRVGCGVRGTSASSGGAGGTLTLGTIEVIRTIKSKNGNKGSNINGQGSNPGSQATYALSAYDNTKTGYGAGTGSWYQGGNVYGIAGIIKIEVA